MPLYITTDVINHIIGYLPWVIRV